MEDAWSFGWNQLLTILGFVITIGIAFSGFRTFGQWKREKIEEKKIDTALEALSIAHESKFIFGHIRSPMAFGYEWQDMPEIPSESEIRRNHRGGYFAPLKRIHDNKEFFDRVFRLQPRFMAIFGAETEELFMILHTARRDVEVAGQMLMERSADQDYRDAEDRNFWEQLRRDIWYVGNHEPDRDRVTKKLNDFRDRMEAVCRPVIERNFRNKQTGRAAKKLVGN